MLLLVGSKREGDPGQRVRARRCVGRRRERSGEVRTPIGPQGRLGRLRTGVMVCGIHAKIRLMQTALRCSEARRWDVLHSSGSVAAATGVGGGQRQVEAAARARAGTQGAMCRLVVGGT